MIEKTSLILCFILANAFMIAQEGEEWVFEKEKDSIRIFTRFADDSDIKELKIEMEVESSLASIVHVVDDLDNYKEWVYKSNGAKLIKRLSATEVIYFNEIDFPWPLCNREVLMHSTLTQDEETRVITYESVVCEEEDLVEVNGDNIRLSDYYSKWTITPQEFGKVNIVYEMKSDPAGYIPTWLINLAIDTGIVETMTNFRTLLRTDKYANCQLDHIAE